jgi:uncharacterized protein YecE (DUF72 family)
VIRVGPAGWKYKDWGGIVYPQSKPRGFDELAYLSAYFDTIENQHVLLRSAAPKHGKEMARERSQERRIQILH